MKIRLSKSHIGEREFQAVKDVLEKGYLGMGQEVMLFEDELRQYFGGDMNVVCVSSGTAALQLALQSHGIGRGDEVIVPSLTYVASFQAISATGAVPVSADVEYETGFLSSVDVASKINKKTKAIMPVHYASSCNGIEDLYDLAKDTNISVIEDAAHSFGGRHKNLRIGSFGETLCFSFDGIKNITCGEGGAIVFRDNDLAQFARDARLLGVEKDTDKRFSGARSWDFDVRAQGWRYHMSNIMAAIGREQLKYIDEFARHRRVISKRYYENLSNERYIKLFDFDLDQICPHIFPIRVSPNIRTKIQSSFDEHKIEYGRHYKPNHLLSFYGSKNISLPNTEKLWPQLLTLPLHYDLSLDDVDWVCDVLRASCNGN